jgi:hypothetical protein
MVERIAGGTWIAACFQGGKICRPELSEHTLEVVTFLGGCRTSRFLLAFHLLLRHSE